MDVIKNGLSEAEWLVRNVRNLSIRMFSVASVDPDAPKLEPGDTSSDDFIRQLDTAHRALEAACEIIGVEIDRRGGRTGDEPGYNPSSPAAESHG